MPKRAMSPLQRWRAQYKATSIAIRELKNQARGKNLGYAVWGDFKQPQAQSALTVFQALARKQMADRIDALNAQRAVWRRNERAWRAKQAAAALGEQAVAGGLVEA